MEHIRKVYGTTMYLDAGVHESLAAAKGVCVMGLDLPKQWEWCLVLKVSSLEDKVLAKHTKHYRGKVVEGGRTTKMDIILRCIAGQVFQTKRQ